jgi:hypothetical protein
MGIVDVADFAAKVAGGEPTAITATLSHSKLHQLFGLLRQAVVAPLGPAIFDPDISSLRQNRSLSSRSGRFSMMSKIGSRSRIEKADHGPD